MEIARRKAEFQPGVETRMIRQMVGVDRDVVMGLAVREGEVRG